MITYETCPVCQEPEVKVEHVLEGWSGLPAHLWHCPECGESLVYVAYDCPNCPLKEPAKKPETQP